MEVTILIVGIAIGVAATLLYRQTKTGKRAYFTNQLKQAEKEVWETEFAKFSTMVAYEKQRSLYSQGQDHLAQLKDVKDKEGKARKEELEKKLEELETTLKEYDMILNGTPPSDQYPQGMRGLGEKLEGIAQKKKNISDFIQYNC